MTGAQPPRLVHLDLRDLATRFALSFAVDQAGWTRVGDRTGAHARVADRLAPLPDEPALDVLVLAPTPANSRRGIDAFTSGLVRSVVASTDPQALPDALEAGRKGRNLVSGSVLQAAQGFPSLTPRLERTLLLLVRGRANRDIARELGQSEATTKRDVADLLRRFDAPNRVALAATAWRLGLSPDARPDMLQA
jgi:DNA-binding NarL/FixJ family response regulator